MRILNSAVCAVVCTFAMNANAANLGYQYIQFGASHFDIEDADGIGGHLKGVFSFTDYLFVGADINLLYGDDKRNQPTVDIKDYRAGIGAHNMMTDNLSLYGFAFVENDDWL